MKKRLRSIVAIGLFAVLMLCAFSGCGKKEAVYTVKLKDGQTKKMTYGEIYDIQCHDDFSWGNYRYAEISGEGKITSIKKGASPFFLEYTLNYSYVTVSINDDIGVLLYAEAFNADDFAIGDNVRFEGKIYETMGSGIYVQGYYSDSDLQPHIFKK